MHTDFNTLLAIPSERQYQYKTTGAYVRLTNTNPRSAKNPTRVEVWFPDSQEDSDRSFMVQGCDDGMILGALIMDGMLSTSTQ